MVVKAMQAAVDVWDNPRAMVEDWENSYPKKCMEELVAELVGSVDTVADLGCGSGRYTKRLKYKAYSGFDSSSEMLKWTADKRHFDNVKFFQKDIFEYQNPAMYDVVLLIDVLQHQTDPIEAMKQLFAHWNGKRYIFTVLVGEKAEVLLNSTVVEQTQFDRALRKVAKVLRIKNIPLEGETFNSALYEVTRK